MTLLNVPPPYTTVASAVQRRAHFLLKSIGSVLDSWVAAAIKERTRRAELTVLHRLTDRELKDMGLTRGDLGDGLAEAANSRNRLQQPG